MGLLVRYLVEGVGHEGLALVERLPGARGPLEVADALHHVDVFRPTDIHRPTSHHHHQYIIK
jgi:hypothetical protein